MNNNQRLEATHFIEQYNGKATGGQFFTAIHEILSLQEFTDFINSKDMLSLVAIFKIKFK